MNKHILARLFFLGLLVSLTSSIQAQTGFGEVRGKVYNDSLKPLNGASVSMYKDGLASGATITDNKGNFSIKGLEPGDYILEVTFIGLDTFKITQKVREGINLPDMIKLSRSKGKAVKSGVVIRAKSTVIDRGSSSKTISAGDIAKVGTRSVGALAANQAGVTSTAQGISFRGSRSDGTAYYVDGVRAIGGIGSLQASIGQVSILQGGVPAMYGDFTGGAISITTRGPSRFYQGSAEFITSNFLDPYLYNQFEGALSGPLYIKNKGVRGKERVLAGFLVAGNVNYMKDPSPSAVGVYRVKEDKLTEIENNPLVFTQNGYVHSSNYLTNDDLENLKARPNSRQYLANLQAKLDFSPTKNTTFTAFGSYYGSNNKAVSNTIMNFDANPITLGTTTRFYGRFTQKFGNPTQEKMDSRTTMRNFIYTLRFDYQNTKSITRDAKHLDNIFDYGYVGTFKKYPTEAFAYSHTDVTQNPNKPGKLFVDQNGDSVYLTDYWEQIGFRDTLLTFNRSELNPLRANYTSNLYNNVQEAGGKITNDFAIIQNLGMLNGYNPPSIYSIWSTPGTVTANYSKSQTERFTVFGVAEGTLKGSESKGERAPHDIQFGFSYEQQTSRGYGLGANGLWILMNQLANKHISQLDVKNPILSYSNGVFQDTVRYNRLVNYGEQTYFDKKFRESLINKGAVDVYGKPISQTTFLDVNSYKPSDFNVNMFNADELLNNGNGYVSYYGYDHLGNKVKGKPSINEFLNNKDKRTIGAFSPIYGAAWLQDQFVFKDLIFRLGVRVERYDANQIVLKDQYSLYPVKTVGEVKSIGGNQVLHPENMGEDFKVYVNDIKSPTKVLGYRNGNRWYDAQGAELSNPEVLANQTSSGKIAPYLVDPNKQQITANSFEDYKPTINVLPRIWFQFPINKDALFFASYDVMAQRPSSGASFLSIDELYFIQQRQGGTLSNGALKPRIKTDYEIGFKQLLTPKSGLEITASYSEIRNDFQIINVLQAYPIQYSTYGNIDFSTIKGFMAEYTLRDLGNVSISANYTLQFADGTGSNANSQRTLLASNQPNFRNMLPLGELDIRHSIKGIFNIEWGGGIDPNTRRDRYNGPMWGKTQILKNTRFNFLVATYSGGPYTPTTQPVQIGTVDRAQIKGNPYSARLNWQYNVNMQINKAFEIRRTKPDALKQRKPIYANLFLWVENLLDVRNILGVYPYTGLPDDDGFLNSPQGQLASSRQISAQSYNDLYKVYLNNPGNFNSPRTVRLGLRLNFN